MGLIDIINLKAYKFIDGIEETFEEINIPEEYNKKIHNLREELIDAVLVYDDKLMEKYLSNGKITGIDLEKVIRKATLSADFFPVIPGSAFKHKGIRFLLDCIVKFLPSPFDIKYVEGINLDNNEKTKIYFNENDKFVGLAFKIATDPFSGKLTFLRVYSGILKKGEYYLNTSNNNKERISRILRIHANKREEINEAKVGDIVGLIGCKTTFTGNTLTQLKNNIALESIHVPDPVISLSIEVGSKAEQEKLTIALLKLSEEDPTFKFHYNNETSQMIISGMGELHLDIIIDRLRSEFKIIAKSGKPEVSYRETITQKGEVEAKYIRQWRKRILICQQNCWRKNSKWIYSCCKKRRL